MAGRRKETEAQQDDDFVSLYGAATRLGISTKTVLARIVSGELQGQQIAGRIVVSRESVERLRKQRKQAGAA